MTLSARSSLIGRLPFFRMVQPDFGIRRMTRPASLARRFTAYACMLGSRSERCRFFTYERQVNEQTYDRDSNTSEDQIFLIHKVELACSYRR